MLEDRSAAQKALLDIFVSAYHLPIGLYEPRNGRLEGTFSNLSLANFEPHCELIQSFPGGKLMCEQDQCNRAQHAINSAEERLT